MATIRRYDKGSREEEAERTLRRTHFAPGAKVALISIFLAAVFSMPVVQTAVEMRHNIDLRGRQQEAGQTVTAPLLPRVCKVSSLLPSAAQISLVRDASDCWDLLADPEDIKRFENDLERDSILSKGLLPSVQQALTRLGGLGNEKALIGRDDWLFYKSDFDYVVKAGFLEPSALSARARAGGAIIQPDPRRAILHLRDQLRQRGVELVIVPAPTKMTIHPEKFSGNYDGCDQPLQNVSFAQFVADLTSQGVRVYDPAPLLVGRKPLGEQYLRTDTHWRPEAMEAVAQELAAFVAPEGLASSEQAELETANVKNHGDIAVMLKLDGRLYDKEHATIQRPQALPESPSDILLLGDSFANIYDSPAMGWGGGAGLARQLQRFLGRPVDSIIQNDNGSYATVQALAGALARGEDRLSGKKLVIWEFAARELAEGNWKLIDLPTGPAIRETASGLLVLKPGQQLRASGVIKEISEAPSPSAPYSDHVMAFHVIGIVPSSGQRAAGNEALVYMLAMHERRLLPPANLKAGDKVQLDLRAWPDVQGLYGSMKRSDLDSDIAQELPIWGQLEAK